MQRFVFLIAALAVLTGCGGPPTSDKVADAIRPAVASSLVIKGYEVPARYVECDNLSITEIVPVGENDGGKVYRVSAGAEVKLLKGGDEIAEDLTKASWSGKFSPRDAIALDHESAMVGLLIGDVKPGRYSFEFTAIIRDYDGNITVLEHEGRHPEF